MVAAGRSASARNATDRSRSALPAHAPITASPAHREMSGTPASAMDDRPKIGTQ